MGYVSKILGSSGSLQKSIYLGSSNEPGQKSMKLTPDVSRVDPSELEQIYVSDSVAFNSVNKATQMIMAAGYELIANNKTVKKYFEEFFNNIGSIGEEITFDELFESIFKYQMIYGNSYIELVFDKKTDSKIVDLTLIDPKRMDYAKTTNNKIVLDKYGRPIGYTLKFSWDVTTRGMGDEIPEQYKNLVSLKDNQIFLLPRRICHFKLYTYGDRFYGLGMIEPSYKATLYKKNIEEAQANSIYQRGTYPIIAYVGNEIHEPTPQDVDNVLKNLVKLKHDRYMAFQNWVKVEPLEVRHSDIIENTLDYLRLDQAASLGMPMAFATGAGEKTNRATLNNQQRFLEFTLNDIVDKTISTFKKYVLKPICVYNKVSKEVPNLKWGAIGAEEINDKAKRLASYVKIGILKPEEVSEFVKKSEDLD